MSDLIGTTLQGKYHITALRGKGGMAEVFKAQHFMVIEYLEGTTLKDKLKEIRMQGRRLSHKDIGYLFTQIAGTAEYALEKVQ